MTTPEQKQAEIFWNAIINAADASVAHKMVTDLGYNTVELRHIKNLWTVIHGKKGKSEGVQEKAM